MKFFQEKENHTAALSPLYFVLNALNHPEAAIFSHH